MEGVNHNRFLELNGHPERRTYQKANPQGQETDVGNGNTRKGGRKGGGKGERKGGTRKKIPKETLDCYLYLQI